MPDLKPVFERLRAILEPYARELDTRIDTDSVLSVDTRHLQKNRQPLYFGGVHLEKSYVSFHLMPVYVDPRLLAGISERLRRRMQGKSCFNFARIDEELFAELAALTKAGYDRYAASGYVPQAGRRGAPSAAVPSAGSVGRRRKASGEVQDDRRH